MIETVIPSATIQPTGNDWHRTSLTFTTLLRPDWWTRWEGRASMWRDSCWTHTPATDDDYGDDGWIKRRNWRWWAGYRQAATLVRRILARPELDVWVPGDVTQSQFMKADTCSMVAQSAGPVLIRNVQGLFDLKEGELVTLGYDIPPAKPGVTTKAGQFTVHTDLRGDGETYLWGAQVTEAPPPTDYLDNQ